MNPDDMATCATCGDVVIYCTCIEKIMEENRQEKRGTLERAIELAVEHHKGQFDKAGKPYILHPLRVMMSVDKDDEKIVAVMHDIVEDTDITLDDLRNEGFSEQVISAIECVTKGEEEDYDSFIERISHNPLAIQVKLADINDNMDLSRLSNVTEKDLERVEKYKKAKEKLLNA
jgi:(p)ppGpp synthase/HD superfamily hydrolase